MKHIFLMVLMALSFLNQAKAKELWLDKEMYVAPDRSFIISQKGIAAATTMTKFQWRIEELKNHLGSLKQAMEMNRRDGFPSHNPSEAQYKKMIADQEKQIADFTETRNKIYGADYEAKSEKLLKKARQLADLHEDAVNNAEQARHAGKPTPKKTAYFTKLEKEVIDLGEELWSGYEKFAKTPKGKIYRATGNLKKAAVVALPLAGAALISSAFSESSGAQASTVQNNDLPEVEHSDDDEARQQQDIEVIDAQ